MLVFDWRSLNQVCALEADIAQISGGHNAEIGERGINLSGGQKTRLSLARAVYADRDVYLLDDVLSAVDPEVCNDIIEDGVLGALRDTTRVLVTNAMHVLPRADLVVVVEAGRIAAVGKYDDLLAEGFDLLNHVAIR